MNRSQQTRWTPKQTDIGSNQMTWKHPLTFVREDHWSWSADPRRNSAESYRWSAVFEQWGTSCMNILCENTIFHERTTFLLDCDTGLFSITGTKLLLLKCYWCTSACQPGTHDSIYVMHVASIQTKSPFHPGSIGAYPMIPLTVSPWQCMGLFWPPWFCWLAQIMFISPFFLLLLWYVSRLHNSSAVSVLRNELTSKYKPHDFTLVWSCLDAHSKLIKVRERSRVRFNIEKHCNDENVTTLGKIICV